MNVLQFATKEVISVRPGDSLDKAISLMEEHGIHHLVVKSGSVIVGILSDRDILLTTGWILSSDRRVPNERKGVLAGPSIVEQIMSYPIVTLNGDQTVPDALTCFKQRKIHALPVVDHDGNAIGIFTHADLLKALQSISSSDNTDPAHRDFLNRRVSDLMRTRVVTVGPETPIAKIITIFRHNNFRHVPVVLESLLIGIISDRDIRRAVGIAYVRDAQLNDQGATPNDPSKAVEIMEPDVRTVKSTSPLNDAIRLMIEHQIHSLPVTDGDALVGIITPQDFVRAVSSEGLL
jgi:CBS domain-containing protein